MGSYQEGKVMLEERLAFRAVVFCSLICSPSFCEQK
jgi:hypothetical protein